MPNKCKTCGGKRWYAMPLGYDTYSNEPCEDCNAYGERRGKYMEEEMVDVVSIRHSELGGRCIFKLEKNGLGFQSPKSLLEEIGLFITEDAGDEWELTVKKYKMKRSEYETMPEFQGW